MIIFNCRFHYTERIFWSVCLIVSIYGAYSLIHQSLIDFDESSVSLVVETLLPNDITYFPSVGLCEIGFVKETYAELETEVKLYVNETNLHYF